MNLIILTPVPVQGASSNTLSTEFIPRTLGNCKNINVSLNDIFTGDMICPTETLQTTRTTKILCLIENYELLAVFPCINNSDLQQVLKFSISFLEIMIHLGCHSWQLQQIMSLWHYIYRTKIVDYSILAKVRIWRS